MREKKIPLKNAAKLCEKNIIVIFYNIRFDYDIT